jgi:hypothetical protein
MRMHTQAVVLLLAATAACGGDRSTKWAGTVTDSAGIQIVANPDAGTWGPEDAWTLKEVLRIGTAEGEPEYQFGTIAAGQSIAIASDGEIVVLDLLAQHLEVFSPDGKYERTIGGPGGGPGELGPSVSAVLIAPGDTLLVADVGNQRANLYLLDGTYLRSFPLNFAEGLPFRWESTRDGRIVVQMRHIALPGATAPPDSMDVIAVRNLDGTQGDTLMAVPSGKTFGVTGGGLPEWHLFTPEPLWALYGAQILSAVSDDYRIGLYEPGGKLTRVITKQFARDPVTDADQQTLKDMFHRLLGQQLAARGAPAQLLNQLMQNLHIGAYYPAFAQMLEGPNETILVQRFQPLSNLSDEERKALDPTSGAMASRQWDVFGSDGRYLGVVSMPERFQPVQFKGDRIYGVQRDELDVQYVVVLRVQQGEASS